MVNYFLFDELSLAAFGLLPLLVGWLSAVLLHGKTLSPARRIESAVFFVILAVCYSFVIFFGCSNLDASQNPTPVDGYRAIRAAKHYLTSTP